MKITILTALLVIVTGFAMAQQTPSKVTVHGASIRIMELKLDTAFSVLTDSSIPANQAKFIQMKINEAVQPLYIAYRQRLAFEVDSVAKSKKGAGKP